MFPDLHGFTGQLFEGARMTLLVSGASLVFGTVLGVLGALAKLSGHVPLVWVINGYTTVVRGVPELIIILLFYFGGTSALTAMLGRFVEVDGFSAGVLALTLVFGAYATEIFRGAIRAIPDTQLEAGRSIGLSKVLIWRLVVLPQMWRFALPGLGNLWFVLLKDSSLISIVGIDDLMRKAFMSAGTTRDPLTFYSAAAALYLVFTVISLGLLTLLERRADRGVRLA